MNRFGYVMVLLSLIVGLSLTHVLFRVGEFIDRRSDGARIKLGIAHSLWLAYVFIWIIQFWWFEYRFGELAPDWTWGLYLFLVSYAIVLFLLAVILVPQSLESVHDFDQYFMGRRKWFYWVFLAATGMDIADSFLKGGAPYVARELGPMTWTLWLVSLMACFVGLRSKKLHDHQVWGGLVLACELLQGFTDVPTLGLR